MLFTSGRRPNLTVIAIAVVTVLGIVLRLVGMGRSLWVDEAWVANSVVEPSIGEMYFYEPWLQTSGPLFLLAARLGVQLFGLSNWSLRLVPFISGALACILMAILVRRMRTLPGPVAVLAVATFALSPSAIDYSYTTKQYSSELLGVTALLLAAVCYVERPNRPRFLVLAATSILALALGYGVVLVMPAVLLVACPWFIDWWKTGRLRRVGWRRIAGWLAFGGVALVFFLAEYLYLGRPNSSPELADYWRFPFDGGMVGLIQAFFGFIFLALHHLPAPAGTSSPVVMNILAVVMIWTGLVAAHLIGKRKKTGTLELSLLVSGTTVSVALAATFLEIYPMVERTSLMLLPCVVVIVAAVLELIYSGPLGKLRGKLHSAAAVAVWCVAALVLVSGAKPKWTPRSAEDLDGAVNYLSQQFQPDDHIYVHAAGAEGFKLYSRMLGWAGAPAELGKVGQPCCPRIAEPAGISREAALRQELRLALSNMTGPRLWVLSTARASHWETVGGDHNGMIREFLTEHGCRPDDQPSFHNLSLVAYGCAGDPPRRTAD